MLDIPVTLSASLFASPLRPVARSKLQRKSRPTLQLPQAQKGWFARCVCVFVCKMLCLHALLLARANVHNRTALSWAEAQGHTTTIRTPQPPAASSPRSTAASLVVPPDADEPGLSSPASLPFDIFQSAQRGELQKVAKWVRKGGPVDAVYSTPTGNGQNSTTATLLYAAAASGHLEMVRELLKQGASVDLPTNFGETPLMSAAINGHLSSVLFLLHHSANPNVQSSRGQTALMGAVVKGHEACVKALLLGKANPDLQSIYGSTALMLAAERGHEACVKALLLAKADTGIDILVRGEILGITALVLAEAEGHTAIAALIRQHTASPQPTASAPAAPPDAGEPTVNSLASPIDILETAQYGELQRVVEWLRSGGLVDTLHFGTNACGQVSSAALLHVAAAHGQLEMVRELLARGASIDLQTSLGGYALGYAAAYGYVSTVLLLLQRSANPDLQGIGGNTALMVAAREGQQACVQTLLCAKANTELLNKDGNTALLLAEAWGHTATAELIRKHAYLPFGLGIPLCAVLPLAWPWWVVLSVVFGTIASVGCHTFMAGLRDSQAARQRRPQRPAPQPVATVAPAALQAAQTARADAAMEELLAEEAAEQAKGQARSKKSKKKQKAGLATTASDEPSDAPPAAAPAPPPAAAPKPVASAAERAEAAQRAAIAGGGFSALEAALAAAPRSGLGVEARARCDRLLEVQQEAERKAKQEAAAEVAGLAASQRMREVAARAAAAFKAREEAVVAVAKADALERAMAADGGEGGSSGAAGPSEASEASEVPDDYICPITAEIMTDPVSTADGFTYEREAISEWLRTKDTSPRTGAKLESKKLIPIHSLRSIIRSFVEASAAAPSSPSPAV